LTAGHAFFSNLAGLGCGDMGMVASCCRRRRCDICLERCDEDGVLSCGHPVHARCLSLHQLHRTPSGWCSLQVHDSKMGCPTCGTPHPPAACLRDVQLMVEAMERYVVTEYAVEERSQQRQRLLHSTGRHYHWCATCACPQFVPQRISCHMEATAEPPPCPTCRPEEYQHTCPLCGGMVVVTHGCTQIRHCAEGSERCGAGRMRTVGGDAMTLPAPVPCGHGGGCGCPFMVRPTLQDVPAGWQGSEEDLHRALRRLHGRPYLLTEYHTMHSPGCVCQACMAAPPAPAAFHRRYMAQTEALALVDDY
jgi:hypothetical protein